MLSARPPSFQINTRRIRSFDGTEIAYHVTAAPSPGAPWVVLAGTLGSGADSWRGPVDYLRDRYRFVTWDYRGLRGSARPSPDIPASYAVDHHVRDLEAVLAAEHIESASLVGWSVGVPVILEALRTLSVRVHSVVFISGACGRLLGALSLFPGASTAIPTLLELARRAPKPTTCLTRRAFHRPRAMAWLKRLGMVGRTLDEALFSELATAFGELDMDPFLHNLHALGQHDACAGLASIRMPALVIAGDRDPITPCALAQQMARRLHRAEILVVRGGTHYTPVEYPELIGLRLEQFFREHGFQQPQS